MMIALGTSIKESDDITRASFNRRSNSTQSTVSRRSSPERTSCGTPIRHRPISPHKAFLAVELPDARSKQLLELAAKERALSELKERRRELDLQIAQAEQDVAYSKRQVTKNNTVLQSISINVPTRNILQREREMETLQNLADGVSAIWKDVVHATLGEQATT